MRDLIHISEPRLLFRHNQAIEDPRDGLTLYGPLDESKPYGIKAGVIGTPAGLEALQRWTEWVQRPVLNSKPVLGRPPFPGFETVFRTPWNTKPVVTIAVTDSEIDENLYLDDPHLRVYRTVSLYSNRILDATRDETDRPELWFVVVPDRVWKYCRPKSVIEPALRQAAVKNFKQPKQAKAFYSTRSLFSEMESAAEPYVYEEQFHNQLKARLLEDKVLTQIIRESTLSNILTAKDPGFDARAAVRQSEIAWNLSTGIFYKVGGRPWKVAEIRKGVCYVGLVFKKDETTFASENACCAAQMFLDSGDGVVFKGNFGPWYSEKTGDFHLSYAAAKGLASLAVESYKKQSGAAPTEMFIHGKAWFDREEWMGFVDAAGTNTKVVGIRIREEKNFKLYRKGANPVLRGLAYIRGSRNAYLWTRGWTPRIQTYPGREVPNPLSIDICRGEADINIVTSDVLSLTKLNYNTCIFGDGMPITLKFADAVGEILTAGPIKAMPPLRFAHYI